MNNTLDNTGVQAGKRDAAKEKEEPSFNATHPELRPGEVFLRNASKISFGRIKDPSKRLGETSYDTSGGLMPGYQPVFVKKI